MRHIAAYLLLQIGGNASPSASDVKRVLGAVGIEADDERLEKLISELEGKDINQVRCDFVDCSNECSSLRVCLHSLLPRATASSPRYVSHAGNFV